MVNPLPVPLYAGQSRHDWMSAYPHSCLLPGCQAFVYLAFTPARRSRSLRRRIFTRSTPATKAIKIGRKPYTPPLLSQRRRTLETSPPVWARNLAPRRPGRDGYWAATALTSHRRTRIPDPGELWSSSCRRPRSLGGASSSMASITSIKVEIYSNEEHEYKSPLRQGRVDRP